MSPAAAALATEMIKYEAHVSGRAAGEPLADHEPWSDEGAFTAGAGLLGMLLHLPVMPKVQPTAAKAGANANGVDTRLLDKVRALLAKAESTEFPEEAESLTAKAQELMARYAIDHAMLGRASAGAGGSGSDTPGGRRLAVDDPYAHGKALLLAAVATANRCCTVWSDAYGFATVVGFGSDIDIVELLYVSLLVQATRAMTAAGAVRDSAGRSRTRSFRQSFLISFAGRIGERLAAATRVATEEAGGVHGSSLLPVLASRVAEVEQARTEMFPHLRSTSARATNHAGWAAGRAAADRANLGPEGELPADVAV